MFNTITRQALIFSTVLLPMTGFADFSAHEQFKMGLEQARYHYSETSGGQHVMDASGPLSGVNASYQYTFNPKYAITLDARGLIGVENYNGHLVNLATGVRTPYKTGYSTRNKLFETRVLPSIQSDGLFFYTGLGYRMKSDESMYSNTYSYPRKSQYLYMPFGIQMPTTYNGIPITPYMEYDLFLHGKQISKSRNIGTTVHEQKSGAGFKAGVAIQVDNVDIVPYINYWHIDDSSVDTVPYGPGFINTIEPNNVTWEVGLKVTYRF